MTMEPSGLELAHAPTRRSRVAYNLDPHVEPEWNAHRPDMTTQHRTTIDSEQEGISRLRVVGLFACVAGLGVAAFVITCIHVS
jgi:hypothetical protein